MSQTEILECSSVDEEIANLGGLNNLKAWLKKEYLAGSTVRILRCVAGESRPIMTVGRGEVAGK